MREGRVIPGEVFGTAEVTETGIEVVAPGTVALGGIAGFTGAATELVAPVVAGGGSAGCTRVGAEGPSGVTIAVGIAAAPFAEVVSVG